ncbi:Uncharacterised protein [Salmonella enterica subsp. arizonae]|uniref:Uncharacterized protein n=1 Tax=Salmonella enterica subsp. arizonae TaxID=59203 RepID=A0A3S4GMZ4_SALER|nr:Uncharacterised protein [Salmonella enterica subsp. arizonae]
METGSIKKALLSLFPLIIMQRPKLHDRSYLPMLTVPLPTGELNWHWVKSATTIGKSDSMDGVYQEA